MFWKGFCNCCVRGLVDYPDGYLLCSKIDRKMRKRCTGGDTRCRRTKRKQTCLRNRRLSTYRINGLRRWSRWVHRVWTRTNCNKTFKEMVLLTVIVMSKKNLRMYFGVIEIITGEKMFKERREGIENYCWSLLCCWICFMHFAE